jgi:hypothetical protein
MQKRVGKFVLDLKRKLVVGAAVATEAAEIFYIAVASGNGQAKSMMVSCCSCFIATFSFSPPTPRTLST